MDLLKIGGWTLFLLLWMTGSVSAQSTEVLWWELEHPDRYVRGYNDPDRDIWELRNEAELMRERLAAPKRLLLRYGAFPSTEAPGTVNQVDAWLTAPDGSRQAVSLQDSIEGSVVEVPGEGAEKGIYLLGSHLDAGRRDVDGDGVSERVHYHGKFLFRHDNGNELIGGERDIFFRSDTMPLEIGPVQASRYSGITQIAHRPYTMAVFYRGQPLAGAEVTIFTERGWQKTLNTDANGLFVVTPVESRGAQRNCEHYLYVVRHLDRHRGEYHLASMPMIVDPPWPEWSNYTSTFIVWTLVGTLFAALLALALILRSRRRRRSRLARFGGKSCA